jgi:hypothetical protein
MRSVLATLESVRSGGLAYDDGDWRPGTPARHTAVTLPAEPEATPVTRFPLPEVVTIPRHVAVRHLEGLAEADLVRRLTGLVPSAVIDGLPEGPAQKGLVRRLTGPVPSAVIDGLPGGPIEEGMVRPSGPVPSAVVDSLPEGPTEEGRQGQRFTYVLDALGVDGRRARGIVRGSDTYGTTATIAVESARRLVAEPAGAGVLAPAQAFGPRDFLDHLADRLRWSIEEPA